MQELRNKIIDEFLSLSAWDGWYISTIKNACKNLNIDENYASILFTDNIDDILSICIEYMLSNMINGLESNDLKTVKIRDRIYLSLKIILEQNIKYKLSVKRLLSFLLLPQNQYRGLSIIYKIVDEIWYRIGDKSTDFNFYTKRFSLSILFFRTITYWVNDDSIDNEKTYKYLKRRIDDLINNNPKKILGAMLSNIPFIRLI